MMCSIDVTLLRYKYNENKHTTLWEQSQNPNTRPFTFLLGTGTSIKSGGVKIILSIGHLCIQLPS